MFEIYMLCFTVIVKVFALYYARYKTRIAFASYALTNQLCHNARQCVTILTIIDVTYKIFAIIGVIITSIAALYAIKKGK